MDSLKFFANHFNSNTNRTRALARVLFLFVLCFSLQSCFKEEANKNISPEQAALIKKGKLTFMTYCIVCHNVNPKLAGATGPSNWGSSLELVTLKVLYGKYPKGYKPKRKSILMPKFEDDLEEDIKAIHAFLNN